MYGGASGALRLTISIERGTSAAPETHETLVIPNRAEKPGESLP